MDDPRIHLNDTPEAQLESYRHRLRTAVAQRNDARKRADTLRLERDVAQAEAAELTSELVIARSAHALEVAELRDEIRMAYGRGRDDEADLTEAVR
jgi:hypothetical protein